MITSVVQMFYEYEIINISNISNEENLSIKSSFASLIQSFIF